MSDLLEAVDWSKWDSKEDNFAKYRHVKSELIYGKLPEQKPDVSIMIPTFRRADLLEEAIDSALAKKTQYSFTITVVDNDADVDQATDDLMQQYCAGHENITYYRNAENIGMFGNWNRCIELAQADWLCLLHDDDMLMDNYVEKMISLNFLQNIGIVMSMSRIQNDCKRMKLSFHQIIYSLIGGKIRKPTTRRWKWSIENMFNPTCMFLHKKLCVNIGGFDERFYPSADAIFAMKMSNFYEVIFWNMQLSIRRIKDNSSLNLNDQKGTLKCCFKTGLEYFHKKGYSTRKSWKKAANMTFGAYLGLADKTKPELDNVFYNELGIKGIYRNLIYKKVFYIWYFLLKFFETI